MLCINVCFARLLCGCRRMRAVVLSPSRCYVVSVVRQWRAGTCCTSTCCVTLASDLIHASNATSHSTASHSSTHTSPSSIMATGKNHSVCQCWCMPLVAWWFSDWLGRWIRDGEVVSSTHGQVTTLGKLFTPMCLCQQALQFGTGQRAVTFCG